MELYSYQPTSEETLPLDPPPTRPHRIIRYFEQSFVTCLTCGEPGHMRSDCEKTQRRTRCVYCGNEGHVADMCPESECDICGLSGHLTAVCRGRRDICGTCGKSGHSPDHCIARNSVREEIHIEGVRCLFKGCEGHCNCYELQGYSRMTYCCKCGEPGHEVSQCRACNN